MKPIALLALLILQLPAAFGQNTIGLPDVVNYSKKSYGGGLQNWDIDQDSSGVIYVGNNEGVLSFDGRFWNLHALPNRTIVRSVLAGPDNRLYVGGQDELGYFSPDKAGKLVYNSLLNIIPKADRSFGDVWDIVRLNNDIWFRCAKVIFRYSGAAIASFQPPTEWAFLESLNGKLYAQDIENGLMVFENNAWRGLFSNKPAPSDDVITGLHATEGNQIMITYLKSGVFLTDGEGLQPIQSADLNAIKAARVYSTAALTEKRWALATSTDGLYIMDRNGKRVQHFGQREGLQNNNVLCVFADRNGNLWLGLDNGIDYIAFNSAIKLINPAESNAAAYAALIQDGSLYVGTPNGVLACPLEEKSDLSFSQSNFHAIENTKGQTWSLTEINNQILLGHHEGAFRIQGDRAIPIQTGTGFWNFKALSATFPTERILAGNYRGLQYFQFSNNQFIPAEKLLPFEESSRYVVIDGEQRTWVSHPYHGVFRLKEKGAQGYEWVTYNEQQGLPSRLNNHVFKVREQLLVGTEKGVYRYDSNSDRFEPDPVYKKILSDQSIRYLQEDLNGNVWFFHEKNVGWIDRTSGEPSVVYLPELNNRLLSGFEFIYPYNEQNVFLAGESGLYHVNLQKYRLQQEKLEVRIRSVRLGLQADSILYGGFNSQALEKTFEIDPPGKNIRFEFTAPPSTLPESLEYSYRLEGFENRWSEWTKRNEKEFTNLPPGDYRFEVKVRNNLGAESEAAHFSFRILPPWYRTPLAWMAYIFLLIGLLWWRFRYSQNKFRKQQLAFEEAQKQLRYIHELERSRAEGELITLRSQHLESEIQFKNAELAASAMHLVKKGGLITQLKTELNQLMRRVDAPAAQSELKKMIKQLEEDEQIDQEWDQFAKHFDKVHSDFVLLLKAKHPDISPGEIKLCSFLRMNLSSKEIAQLLNISVRGVEISRYRLRKKLNLQNGENLFDYLIGLQQ